ncbi:6624_t:CDS:2 [Entrophospora sp. SA101]|nr:6624_t:CDS:2 [Entrophospora sp. SA101]
MPLESSFQHHLIQELIKYHLIPIVDTGIGETDMAHLAIFNNGRHWLNCCLHMKAVMASVQILLSSQGILLFNKWTYDDVEVKDISLTDYIQIRNPVYLPHTAGLRIVKHAFEIIHVSTDQNPIQVLVDAIINIGPREDSTHISSAGTEAIRESAFRNVKSIAECLADELINAAKGSSNSYAIKKKD